MPPKKKQGSAARGSCSICCQVVLDKDEALFCAGKCQQWLHRYCCSVTEQQYKAITDSKCPFLCPCCDRERQQEEIIELRSTVEAMKLELAVFSPGFTGQRAQVIIHDHAPILRTPHHCVFMPRPLTRALLVARFAEHSLHVYCCRSCLPK